MQILIKDNSGKAIIFKGRYKGNGRNILGAVNQVLRNRDSKLSLLNILREKTHESSTTRLRPKSKGQRTKKGKKK